MPTYDFLCNNCEKRFEAFMTFNEYGKKIVHCIHCNSENVRRRMTKVRIAKSESSRAESAADEFSNLEGIEDNPKALAHMMKKMGNEMGEDLPTEFNEVVDRLEAGQSPAEIESALPDLGANDTDSG
jgi:putative FmdB family regulatory protein